MDSAKISGILEELRPAYASFLSDLIKLDSTRGNEGPVQALIRRKMESLGLPVAVVKSREDDHGINLCATMKGSESKGHRSLILNAHCDITPVDAVANWEFPPFCGTIADDRILGRGALDDKAGIAVILMVADALRRLGVDIKGDILLQSVIEDETTGNGSQALVANGYTADGVLICDGTWPERIIHAHLGQLFLDVTIEGKAVAACVESRGVNPILIGGEFIVRLRSEVEKWNETYGGYASIERPFFANIGSFHSGVWHGSVPVEGKLEVQIGFAHLSPDEVFTRVTEIARQCSERISLSKGLLQAPPSQVPPDGTLISMLRATIERFSENPVQVVAVTGHCDMRHFGTADVCLYGPGGGGNPHGINEYYLLDHMPKVARNILLFAFDWCNQRRV